MVEPGPRDVTRATPTHTSVSALDPLAGLVWMFAVRGSRSVEVGPAEAETAFADLLRGNYEGWHWLHFDLGDRRAAKTVKRLVESACNLGFDVPDSAIEDFLHAGTTPELHYTRGILHGALLDSVIDLAGEKRGEAALLNIVVGRTFVFTGRRRHLRGVEALRNSARAGDLGNHPIRLIEALVRMDTTQREVTIDALTRSLDQIEDRVLSEAGQINRSQVIRIRHVLVRQHRELGGLCRLFERVDREVRQESGIQGGPESEWADCGSLLQHFSALVDRCLSLHDRARLLQQEVSDQLTAQTNRQLYVLSILTAALVPPTIVVGVFGMNTGGLPLTEVPYGFWLAMLLCVASSVLVLGIIAASGAIERPNLTWWREPAKRPDNGAAGPGGWSEDNLPIAGPWGAQVTSDRRF
jgi:zinc transporter